MVDHGFDSACHRPELDTSLAERAFCSESRQSHLPESSVLSPKSTARLSRWPGHPCFDQIFDRLENVGSAKHVSGTLRARGTEQAHHRPGRSIAHSAADRRRGRGGRGARGVRRGLRSGPGGGQGRGDCLRARGTSCGGGHEWAPTRRRRLRGEAERRQLPPHRPAPRPAPGGLAGPHGSGIPCAAAARAGRS
jgi:hypothetical protein